MEDGQDKLNVLRKIIRNPETTQRELAKDLGFSLGKLNYILSALKDKGLVKIKNFRKNPNKLNYFYVLTPKGITLKTSLTLNFTPDSQPVHHKRFLFWELKSEPGSADQ